MSEQSNETPSIHIGFDVAELSVIKLEPGDVLAVKLIGDDFHAGTMRSLQENLSRVFTKNKVMVFTMPNNTDIVFEKIQQPTEASCSEPTSYCSDCNCGKKEKLEGN